MLRGRPTCPDKHRYQRLRLILTTSVASGGSCAKSGRRFTLEPGDAGEESKAVTVVLNERTPLLSHAVDRQMLRSVTVQAA